MHAYLARSAQRCMRGNKVHLTFQECCWRTVYCPLSAGSNGCTIFDVILASPHLLRWLNICDYQRAWSLYFFVLLGLLVCYIFKNNILSMRRTASSPTYLFGIYITYSSCLLVRTSTYPCADFQYPFKGRPPHRIIALLSVTFWRLTL